MPKILDPIPVDAAIVEGRGVITTFFRLRWEQLRALFQLSPSVALIQSDLNQSATVVTTNAYTTASGGRFRVSWYLRKTVADGVNSSLTITLGWVESAVALTEPQAALVTDTIFAEQNGSVTVEADPNSALTFAIAYASNTPAKMRFRYTVIVEQIA
jgi:hypothetical protein